MYEKYTDSHIEDECCECCCQNECDDEVQEEINLISEYVDKIIDLCGCPDCTFRTVMDLYFTAKSIGASDYRDYIKEIVSE